MAFFEPAAQLHAGDKILFLLVITHLLGMAYVTGGWVHCACSDVFSAIIYVYGSLTEGLFSSSYPT